MAEYSFRPLVPDDKPLICRWLAQPHIADWWGDGETEWAMMEADLTNPVISMSVVEVDGMPFAYLQDYDAHFWPMPQYSDAPQGTRALDTFLGDPAFLGQGHGSGYIAARLADLRATAPLIVTDPDPENTRAVAAYAKAGFRRHRITPCEDGDLVQVMIHP